MGNIREWTNEVIQMIDNLNDREIGELTEYTIEVFNDLIIEHPA